MAGIGGALVGAPPPLTPEKTALHTKSAQTAGLEAIWCEVLRKILRNTHDRTLDPPSTLVPGDVYTLQGGVGVKTSEFYMDNLQA
ncbi:hypothetical protein BT091_02445 [Corynebacterium diphtheriae]|nr:hypothetical protein BT091_02445 [Corynebacterium diphtheriae]